jgi:hypothetical protein
METKENTQETKRKSGKTLDKRRVILEKLLIKEQYAEVPYEKEV